MNGDEIVAKAPFDLSGIRIQIARTQKEYDVSFNGILTTDEYGLVKEVRIINDDLNKKSLARIYHVEKDGSGDFIKLVDAIEEAEKYMDSIVYVGKGEWDLIDELGSEYIESVSSSRRGVYLKNRIHVICSSRAVITCKYTGIRELTREWLSAFNSGPYGFTLENARIETDNVRYSMHDERDSDDDSYTNHYINCSMIHKNGKYLNCIGGGLGRDGHIIVEGCYFEGESERNNRLVYWHNSGDGYWTQEESKGAKSTIEIKGSYFEGKGTFFIQDFGKSEEVTVALCHGNSMGSIPYHGSSETYSPHENTKLIAWNNEIRSNL